MPLQFVYVVDASSNDKRERTLMPPIAIKRFTSIRLHDLFSNLFRCLRRDLEKHCRERLKFNKLTADDDAFTIHFLRPNERPPLFKIKVLY